MHITTFIGIILGFGFIIWGISFKGGFLKVYYFLEPASFVLVLGCSISALIINYPLREIINGIKALKYLFKKPPIAPEEIIKRLVDIAIKARREGFLSLREESTQGNLPLLDLGLGLVADGTDSETTRKILETAILSESNSLGMQERIWRDFGVYAPMFGMLGTIIGLVLMLKGLSDPSTIGPAMALALITTFYGIMLAGLVALPIAGKIRNYGELLNHINELIIEGIISIQAGDNSQIVEEKLKAHLSKR